MVWKQYAFSRHHTSNFERWAFPGLAILGGPPGDAGQRQRQRGSSQPRDHEGEQSILQCSHCIRWFCPTAGSW